MSERAEFLDRYVIYRAVVGSTAHGVTHSTNDRDEIAVYIPPIREVVGMSTPEHYIYRPGRGPTDPSSPGDLDRTYYSLAKFVRLLDKGNPSILFTLFGVKETVQGRSGIELIELRDKFVNDKTRRGYMGYMMAQRQRITGERGSAGRIRRSPEGGGEIDWKYAMHMVRLGVQGFEYLTTGHITCPSLERELLLDIRSGKVPLDEVTDLTLEYEDKLKSLDLPKTDNSEMLNSFLEDAHLDFWRR